MKNARVAGGVKLNRAVFKSFHLSLVKILLLNSSVVILPRNTLSAARYIKRSGKTQHRRSFPGISSGFFSKSYILLIDDTFPSSQLASLGRNGTWIRADTGKKRRDVFPGR